jgi:hypothetical protein
MQIQTFAVDFGHTVVRIHIYYYYIPFLFLIIGLIGSISSIEEDWLNQGKPFSCQ